MNGYAKYLELAERARTRARGESGPLRTLLNELSDAIVALAQSPQTRRERKRVR